MFYAISLLTFARLSKWMSELLEVLKSRDSCKGTIANSELLRTST